MKNLIRGFLFRQGTVFTRFATVWILAGFAAAANAVQFQVEQLDLTPIEVGSVISVEISFYANRNFRGVSPSVPKYKLVVSHSETRG